MNRRLMQALGMAALGWLLVTPATVHADEVLWELGPTTFSDGATMDGFFVYDAPTGETSFWDFEVDPGFPPFTAFRYQSGEPGHSVVSNGPKLYFQFGIPDTPGYRRLEVESSYAILESLGSDGELGPNLLIEQVWTGFPETRSVPGTTPFAGEYLANRAPIDVTLATCRAPRPVHYGDPVSMATGAFTYAPLLLQGLDNNVPFAFELYYDSSADPNWTHKYAWRIDGIGSPWVTVVQGNRAADYFNARPGGVYNAVFPQTRAKLEERSGGGLVYTDPERTRYVFDANGRLVAISAHNDQTAQINYDANGRLASFVEPAPASRTATFAYDSEDALVSIEYESGPGLQRVNFTYDANDNLASFSAPRNPALTARFTYDGAGRLLTGTMGTGPADDVRAFANTYDASGRVVSQLDANGQATTFTYNGSQATATNPLGRANTRTFDPTVRLVGATDERSADFSWTYDNRGNLTEDSGPRESARTTSYDPNTGNVTGITLENGDSVGLNWDANSYLTGIVDGNGKTRSYTYDTSGNVTDFTNALGNGIRYQHDTNGRLTTMTDASGIVTSYDYNALGQLATITRASAAIGLTYDALGNANSYTDPNNHTTSLAYDAAGAISSITDGSGLTTTFTNDVFGRIMTETRPDGRAVTFERDALGNITATMDGSGNRFQYSYDAAGQATSKTNPLGAQTNYVYGATGQLERTTDALGNPTSASYTSAGLQLTVTNPNGNTISFEHDTLGRLTSETDALSRQSLTEYDAAGSVSAVTNRRGQTITYEYDDAGSMITANLPGDIVRYTVDAEGRRTSSTHTAGTTSIVYDTALGRVQRRTDELGNAIGYAYDAAGNLASLTYSDGKTVSYTYDEANRMTTVQDWAGRTTTYTYDTGGSLAGATLPDGSSVTYTYDVAGRVTAMDDRASSGSTVFSGRYTYDAAGQTLSADESLPIEPTITAGTAAISYDAADQITTANGNPFGFDQDGNLSSGTIEGSAVSLAYDSLNRLVQHNSDVYTYDPDNFRIRATRGGVTTRYVWDGISRTLRLLEEQDATGRITARYVHGIGLIGREEAGTNELLVYHFDPRGSTVALTNPAGAITDRYAYDPYGQIVNRQGSTPNPFTYNGRDGVFDDANGFYYMTSRYYIPSLGRFAQQEPLYRGSLLRPQSLNRYAYVEGNPIDRIDPRGELWGFITAAVGAVVSVGAQVVSNAIDGKPFYEDIAGAAVKGAISGAAISLGPWGQAAAGAVGGALGDLVDQGINIATGKQNSIDLLSVGTDFATGAVFGRISGRTPKPGSVKDVLKNASSGLSTSASAKALGKWAAKKGGLGLILNQGESRLGGTQFDPRTWNWQEIVNPPQSSDIISNTLDRPTDSCAPRLGGTVADMWGLGPVAWPGYLTDGAYIVPGNPQ